MTSKISKKRQIGSIRWEFARRNNKYRTEYFKKSRTNDVIDLTLYDDIRRFSFLERYYIYPLNPDYTFSQIIQYKKELDFLQTERFRRKAWKDKQTKEHKEYKTGSSQLTWVKFALDKLMDIELSNEESDGLRAIYGSTVLNSYLEEDNNFTAFRWGDSVELCDNRKDEWDLCPFVEEYDGDLNRVCFEIDISFSTKRIIEDIKKEISTWKKIERKFSKKVKERQRLSEAEVRMMLKIYDLRNEGAKFKEIADIIYSDVQDYSIQKTRNMYRKAKKYIEGQYKQIR